MKIAFRMSIVAAVTVAAIVLLFRFVDAGAVLRMLASIDVGWTFAGLLAFLLGHLLRYWRYSLVWAWRRSPEFLATTALHGFASYVLPLRLGELVLPAMVRRQGVSGFPQALGGLLMVRVYDALLVLILGAILVMVRPDLVFLAVQESGSKTAIMFGATLAVVLCFTGLWFISSRLRSGQTADGRMHFSCLSILIWLSVMGMNFCVMRALGLESGAVVLVLLLALGVVITIVPVQGLAGLGGHQIVWVLSLSALGMKRGTALDIAMASHVLIILYICALGLVGLGLMFWVGRRSPAM